MSDRYEEARQQCLRWANLHPDSDAVCHQAVAKAKHLDGLSYELAAVLDDEHLRAERLRAELTRLRAEHDALVERLRGLPRVAFRVAYTEQGYHYVEEYVRENVAGRFVSAADLLALLPATSLHSEPSAQ